MAEPAWQSTIRRALLVVMAVLPVALLGFLLLMAPPAAAQPDLVRGWTATEIDPGRDVRDVRTAPFGPGETLVLYTAADVDQRAQVIRGGVALPSQDLPDPGYWNNLALDGSPVHGAVAAWATHGVVRVAQIAPGEDQMTVVREVAAAWANYSYGRPVVQMGPGGETVVAYVGTLPGEDGARVMALVRDGQGEWSEPLPVTPLGPTDSRFATSAAVAPDGTVVVGAPVDRTARVAVRPPGGRFTLSEPLGEQLPEHPWNGPRVGVDAAGTVVAAWLEGAPLHEVGPIKIAFRPPLAEKFAPPQATGLQATDVDRIALGVSTAGEVVLMAEAGEDNPSGGWYKLGVFAAYGLTHLQRMAPAARISDEWFAFHPSFDMNARGDAVVVWDECCPMTLKGRRRAPLTPFGPLFDAAEPIVFEGWRGGRWMVDADMDAFGNARGAWYDSEVSRWYAGGDGPLLDAPLPEVGAVGDVIPPVLPRAPEPTPGSPAGGPGPGPTEVPPLIPQPVPAGQTGGLLTADRRAPEVSLTVRPGAGRRHVLTSISCDETCGVRLRARAHRRSGRYVDVLLRDGRRQRLGLPLPRRSRGTIRIEGVVSDGAGNVARVSRRVARR
jgi:hypothetical protein